MLTQCAPNNIACNAQALLADPINAVALCIACAVGLAYIIAFKLS